MRDISNRNISFRCYVSMFSIDKLSIQKEVEEHFQTCFCECPVTRIFSKFNWWIGINPNPNPISFQEYIFAVFLGYVLNQEY